MLPSPLLLEVTLVLAGTSPTLPELSMLPRERLRPRLMLRLTPPCSTPPTVTDSPMPVTTPTLPTVATPATTDWDTLTTLPQLLPPTLLPPPLSLPQLSLLPPQSPLATPRSAPPPP